MQIFVAEHLLISIVFKQIIATRMYTAPPPPPQRPFSSFFPSTISLAFCLAFSAVYNDCHSVLEFGQTVSNTKHTTLFEGSVIVLRKLLHT